MLRVSRRLSLVVLTVLVGAACDQAAVPGTGPRPSPVPVPRFTASDSVDETDGWEYMSEDSGTFVVMRALDQTPQPEDGTTRVCPNDQLIYRNAHLRMRHNGENIDLDFRGPFEFVRRVSSTSPYPTAVYRFSRDAYTFDKKYLAPAGNTVNLACDGYYVLDNRAIRLWVGHFYGKLYNGPIEPNPDYCEGGGGGGGGGVDNTEYDPYAEGYDPYSAGEEYSPSTGGQDCSGGGGDGDGDGGGGDGGGGSLQPGPGGGGSSGLNCPKDVALYYDEICIDIWVENVGWVEWWCGVAAICG